MYWLLELSLLIYYFYSISKFIELKYKILLLDVQAG